ncbi:hypothetical protein CP532_5849 [Ophiocordyceps camponoti-leonardi (nom. inval.)]|nr:hypothetical protein CP532_5849 [Ophiocordyceps camponoti-leonardi (nom. inval.)]
MTSSSGSEGEPKELTIGRRRVATVFDAVEGTVLPDSFIWKTAATTEYSSRNQPLTPDEVLFRCRRAPQRYEEYDIYRAHDDLPQGGHGVLPESNMLRAIHSYVRRFYKALTRGKTLNVNERSMDETALLAFGILLEEAVKEILGENGDLVFTERAGADGEARRDANRQNLEPASRKKKRGKGLRKKRKKKRKTKARVSDDADEVAQRSHEVSMTPDKGVSDMGTGGDEVAAGCHVNSDKQGGKRRWSAVDDDSGQDEAEQSVSRIHSAVGTAVSERTKKRAKKRPKKRPGFC